MFLFLKNQLKSLPPVSPHFIERGRKRETAESPLIYFFRKSVRYLFTIIYILIYIKYLVGVRLFSHMLAFPEKKREKKKRKGGGVDLSYSYEIFEHKLLFIKCINTQNEGRLGSLPPVSLLSLQSLFENTCRSLKWS